MSVDRWYMNHGCSTLVGSTGSALLDFEHGEAVGLHHAGAFEQANFAVKASKLGEVPHELQVLWNHLGRGGGEDGHPGPLKAR